MTLSPRATNGEITDRIRPHIPTAVRRTPARATTAARITGSIQAPVSQ